MNSATRARRPTTRGSENIGAPRRRRVVLGLTMALLAACSSPRNEDLLGSMPDAGADAGVRDVDAETTDAARAADAPDAHLDAGVTDAKLGWDAAPDPCPLEGIAIDCSNDCGGPTPNCANTACGVRVPSEDVIEIETTARLPMRLRTPHLHNSGDGNCAYCGHPAFAPSVYGMYLQNRTGRPLKVTVGAPWLILTRPLSLSQWFCHRAPRLGEVEGCYAGDLSQIVIVTDDPNAPARNVVIEEQTAGVTCP
jgi:hypothetical protein